MKKFIVYFLKEMIVPKEFVVNNREEAKRLAEALIEHDKVSDILGGQDWCIDYIYEE